MVHKVPVSYNSWCAGLMKDSMVALSSVRELLEEGEISPEAYTFEHLVPSWCSIREGCGTFRT